MLVSLWIKVGTAPSFPFSPTGCAGTVAPRALTMLRTM